MPRRRGWRRADVRVRRGGRAVGGFLGGGCGGANTHWAFSMGGGKLGCCGRRRETSVSRRQTKEVSHADARRTQRGPAALSASFAFLRETGRYASSSISSSSAAPPGQSCS